MSTVSFSKYFDVTIANGQTDSDIVLAKSFEDMVAIIIAAPAALPETIKIQVNTRPDGSGTWSVLQDDTPADLAGPLAGKARHYTYLVGAPAFKLVANVGVAAPRVFTVSGQWTA